MKFKVGDLVRVVKTKTFENSYPVNFKWGDIMVIDKILPHTQNGVHYMQEEYKLSYNGIPLITGLEELRAIQEITGNSMDLEPTSFYEDGLEEVSCVDAAKWRIKNAV